MPSAICPHCSEPAFSSAEFTRTWTCPTCGQAVVPTALSIGEKVTILGKDPVIDAYSRYWGVPSSK